MNRGVRICVAAVILVLVLISTGCSPAAPAASSADSTYARIDSYIQQRMRSDRIPGLAIGIVKGSETVYLKGFGIADPSGRAVTPETPFELASVSKSITALAVMQLVEAGRMNLDDPVTKYLPGFATADKESSSLITVRQLLNQTSGLSTATGNQLNVGNGGKPLDAIVEQLTHAKLVSRPGATLHYSNANYVLLADIVEHVVGQTYGEYVQSHIFKPLNMGSSSANGTAGVQGSIATGFRRVFGFPIPMQPYHYVECLNNVSTARDMANYLSAVMSGGSFKGASICSASTLEQMQKPAAQMGAGLSYAMGFEVDSSKPYPLVMHPGDTAGFNANIAILPQGNWGVIVLENVNWMGMEGEIGGVIAGIENILEDRVPPSQLLSPGKLAIFFDAVWLITLFFLLRAFIRINRWKGKIESDGAARLRRRWIPIVINNFSVPTGMLVFVPMAFSANWASGFLHGPDFSLMMIAISTLLMALGALRGTFILRRAREVKKGGIQ